MDISLISSNSSLLKQSINIVSIFEILIKISAVIFSAFFGGLFAGVWSNHFESKRRISEKRRDKYFEHRNTIVQIEHEFIPIRVNMSRNLASLTDALDNTKENTHETNIRLILRFYKLNLSLGLSLRLLNIDLINMYSEIYSLLETINSDIDYISSMVSSLREGMRTKNVDVSLLQSYVLMLSYVKEECEKADKKSLTLLALCKIAIGKNDKEIMKKYIKNGNEIKYLVQDKTLKRMSSKIEKEEKIPYREGEIRPKFFVPFLDLKRVIE